MTLPEFSIKRHVLAFMLSAVLVLFGTISYQRIGMDRFPHIEFPIVSISTTLKGANPDIVDASVTNVIELHFATTLRHRPLGELVIYELVTGPMNAGLFPTHDLDPSLSPERLFFHGPDHEPDIRSFDEALSFMSWGSVSIDRHGTLTYEVRSIGGRALYSLSLDP